MERTFWTDERLDEVIARIDGRFDRLEDRMDSGLREVRGEIAHVSHQLTQIGWALAGVLLVQIVAGMVALVAAFA